MTSQVAQPEIVNSDNGVKADGAMLDFTSLLPKDGLKPKEASGEKTLTFHLANAKDFRQGGEFKSQLVLFDARVLGQPTRPQ